MSRPAFDLDERWHANLRTKLLHNSAAAASKNDENDEAEISNGRDVWLEGLHLVYHSPMQDLHLTHFVAVTTKICCNPAAIISSAIDPPQLQTREGNLGQGLKLDLSSAPIDIISLPILSRSDVVPTENGKVGYPKVELMILEM